MLNKLVSKFRSPAPKLSTKPGLSEPLEIRNSDSSAFLVDKEVFTKGDIKGLNQAFELKTDLFSKGVPSTRIDISAQALLDSDRKLGYKLLASLGLGLAGSVLAITTMTMMPEMLGLNASLALASAVPTVSLMTASDSTLTDRVGTSVDGQIVRNDRGNLVFEPSTEKPRELSKEQISSLVSPELGKSPESYRGRGGLKGLFTNLTTSGKRSDFKRASSKVFRELCEEMFIADKAAQGLT